MQPAGQLGDRGCLEQGPQVQLQAEDRAYPAHQACGDQRMPTEGKEAVVDADAPSAGFREQDLGEQPAENLLLGRTRRPVALGLPGGRGAAERGPVDLAAGLRGSSICATQMPDCAADSGLGSDSWGVAISITYSSPSRAARSRASFSIASTRLRGRMSVQLASIQSRHSCRLPVGPTFVHPAGTSRKVGHNEC